MSMRGVWRADVSMSGGGGACASMSVCRSAGLNKSVRRRAGGVSMSGGKRSWCKYECG